MSRFSESQTLITGVYRTGSEFLTVLVDGHPEVSASMYGVNALRFLHGRFGPYDDPGVLRAALAKVKERVSGRYGKAMDVEAIARAIETQPPVTLGRVYDATMSLLHLGDNKRHWAEKNQLLWRQVPLFLAMMPNGRAVILIRDPRAVLASFKHFTTAVSPGYLGAVFNCLDAMRHARDLAMALPPERFLVLRNEDLARAPEETARRVWRLIGVDPDVEPAGPENWRDPFGRPWSFNSSLQNGGGFEVERALEGWRDVLSAEEIELVERICGPVMGEFGYQPVNPEAARADAADPLPMEHLIATHPQVSGFVATWRQTGAGCQAFPSDPAAS